MFKPYPLALRGRSKIIPLGRSIKAPPRALRAPCRRGLSPQNPLSKFQCHFASTARSRGTSIRDGLPLVEVSMPLRKHGEDGSPGEFTSLIRSKFQCHFASTARDDRGDDRQPLHGVEVSMPLRKHGEVRNFVAYRRERTSKFQCHFASTASTGPSSASPGGVRRSFNATSQALRGRHLNALDSKAFPLALRAPAFFGTRPRADPIVKCRATPWTPISASASP